MAEPKRTVEELLAALELLPRDAEVKGYYDSGFGTGYVYVYAEDNGTVSVYVESPYD
jgi:hypothetical protein